MAQEFQASRPIYLQAADRIYFSIIRGELVPGEKLPSVRDMAVQMGVNPNTIQRTYTEMEREGIVETRRGQGTYVKDQPDIAEELKYRVMSGMIGEFVNNMKGIGLTEQEMLAGLRNFFAKDRGNV